MYIFINIPLRVSCIYECIPQEMGSSRTSVSFVYGGSCMESLFETDPRALKTASDVLMGGIGEHYTRSI